MGDEPAAPPRARTHSALAGGERAIMTVMGGTSLELDTRLRDALAEIAARDFDGVSLGEAIRRLIKEYHVNRIMRHFEELRADPDK